MSCFTCDSAYICHIVCVISENYSYLGPNTDLNHGTQSYLLYTETPAFTFINWLKHNINSLNNNTKEKRREKILDNIFSVLL